MPASYNICPIDDGHHFGSSPHLPNAGYKTFTSYANYTDVPVYIKDQSNFIVKLMPVSSLENISASVPKGLMIRQEYRIEGSHNVDETYRKIEALIASGQVTSAIGKKFIDSVKAKEQQSNYRTPHTLNVIDDRHISASALSKGDNLHVVEFNIMVTINEVHLSDPHPYSIAGLGNASISDYAQKTFSERGAGMVMKVVDKERKYPSYFYCSGKQVIEVPSIYDTPLPNGVYVTTIDAKGVIVNEDSLSCSIEEAKEVYGLYPSKDEATSAGDRKVQQSIEQLKREEDIAVLRHENEKEKLALDQLRSAMDAQTAMLKAQNAALKEQIESIKSQRVDRYEDISLRRKDLYDERGSRRKDEYDDRSNRRKDKYDDRSTKRKDRSEASSSGWKIAADVAKYGPLVFLAVVGGKKLLSSDACSVDFI